MTTGTLLPVARELRFNFEEPPDPQTEVRLIVTTLLSCSRCGRSASKH